MAAKYTKRDERHAKMVRTMRDWVARGCPEPKLWAPVCCLCGGEATIEVNKHPDVKFYCRDHFPDGPDAVSVLPRWLLAAGRRLAFLALCFRRET